MKMSEKLQYLARSRICHRRLRRVQLAADPGPRSRHKICAKARTAACFLVAEEGPVTRMFSDHSTNPENLPT